MDLMSRGALQVQALLPNSSFQFLKQRPWVSTTVPLVLLFAFLYALWRIFIVLFYQHFHPLAVFRGPKEAVSSRRWIYRVLASGKAEKTFSKLHAKYNVSALRVGPNELHIDDVSAYKSIYCFKTPYTKDYPTYDGFLTPHTVFAETDTRLHHQRSKLLAPAFSKRAVKKLEPVIGDKIMMLAKKIKAVEPGKHVSVFNAFRCMALDIIGVWSFGHDSNMIDESDSNFACKLFQAFDAASPSLIDLQESWVKRYIASSIPLSILAFFNENMNEIYKMQQETLHGLQIYKRRSERPSYPVLLDNMQELSDHDQTLQTIEIVLVGTDTTAFTIAMSIFHILDSPQCTKKLVACLDEQISKPGVLVSLFDLDKLDYLWAVVKECLRVAMPVGGRLPRIVPRNSPPLVVDNKVIPPGTVVGMSARTMNMSPELWGPDATVFRPERWLSPDGIRDPDRLIQHLTTFSQGARQCIGRNLAEAEIIMSLAYFFRTFTMSLKTKHVDVIERFSSSFTESIIVEFVERPT